MNELLSEDIAINTIYVATEGEGIRIGIPQIFVRLQGCPVGCVNCDSKETWAYPSHSFTTIDKVVEKVQNLSSIKRVSVTGGEPLAPKNINSTLSLVKNFKNLDYFLNLETSGVYYHQEIFSLVDFISIDYKTKSTLVKFDEVNLLESIFNFGSKMQVKAVIETEDDFYQILDFYKRAEKECSLLKKIMPPFCLTPCYNVGTTEAPLEMFKKIIHLNEENGGYFRFIGQQHKFIHGPNVRDV